MAKSWEEIKKEREQQVRSSSNPVQSNTSKMINQGFLTSDPKPQQRKWEDIRKDRGYIEPEPPPTDYWKEQPVRTALKNINAGINMLPKGMVGIADATIGSLGIKPVNKFLEGQKDFYKKYDEELARMNQGHEFAGGIAQGIGQAVPTMMLALMNPAAAAGSVVPTTAGGTQLVANAASLANPTTLNAARTVALQLKSNPTLYSSMVTSVGNQYLQGVNEGASREQALKSAIIGGVPSALIEVSGGIENITNILANKTKGLVGAALQAALEEGFEEIMQYPIENIGQKAAFDKNMPLFSMKEQAVINPKEMAFSGLVGATVGGLMGGGAAGVNQALYNSYAKRLNEMYNNTIQNLPEDSPILKRVRQMENDNVNIDDNTKLWVINTARQNEGIFDSQIDELNQKSRQKETFFSNENKAQDQSVVQDEKFVKTQNTASQAVNPVLSAFNIQNINNAREVKQNVYEFYKNSIISDSNTSKPIINKSSGMNIEVSRATINQTFQADDKYIKNQDNEIKVAAMENIVSLIQNGAVEIVDNSKVPSSKVKHADIKGVISFDGVPYDVTLDVRRTDKGNKFFVHSLHTDSKQTENKTSGLIHNGYEQQINPQAYSILDKIGKETGIKIKIVSNIASQDGSNFDFADGQYDRETNTLELSMLAGSDDIILEIAKHELTHMLSQKSPKHYKEYQEYVIKTLKENGKYESLYSYIAMLHNEAGIKYDENYINEELAADAAKMLFTDKSTIDDIAQNNPTLGKKILEIIREIIKKFDTAIQEAKSNIFNVNQMKTAEELWMIALNDVIENRQGNVESQQSKAETDSKFSIKDDVIAEVYGTEQFTVWAGENSQIPFGDFDTEREARDFYNKHKSRLAKFRHSSNLKTDMEYAKTDKEVKELEKLLENSEYIENQYAMYERNKSKPVSINDVIRNIKDDRYRREDLESLAEQVSNGNWDDYEQLTDQELKSDLIDAIESYAKEMNPLERQYDKYGFSVRPSRNVKYSLKDSNGDIRFNLKAPVEETKDLIAIHNMDEDKLKGTLELGGFPIPSIAITKAEQGHDDFGDISVIFTKDTIDPQSDRRNRVFGSDVYSKRFPYVNYKLNSKVVDRIKSKINELTNEEYRKEFRISLDNDNIANTLQTYKSNGDFVKGYIDEPLLKIAFLKEKGIAFKPIMKEKTYGRWEVPLLEKIKKHLGNEEAAITFRNLEDTMKLEPDIRRIVNEFYRTKIKDEALLDFILFKEPMGFGEMDGLLGQVSKYTREGSKKDIDYYKTKEKLEKVTPKKSYRDWLSKLSEGIIEKKGVRNDKDPFTPSGNRRSFEQLNDEYTLDSIIKLMRGDVRGEEGFMYGLGNVRAGMTKEFKSIKDIKQHKDKIVSPEEFREIKEKANQEYYKLSNQFSKYHRHMTGSSDAFDNSMFETAKKGRIVPSVFKAELKEEGYEVNDIPDFMIKQALDFLNSLKEMPTEYFEAKPQRAVGFDEVAAIVAPKRTDKELLQQLKEMAITVVKYDEKIEGDRLKKVNSVKGVKFSLKDSQGRAITQEQAEYFKDSKVRDNNGNLLVMYHGTPKGGFTKFKSGTYFTQNKEYADNYQSPNASSISVKQGELTPSTYEVYLNITKPFDTRNKRERNIFNKEYYNKYGMGTSLMESGLPDWLDGIDLQEFIEEKGYDYDGLILDEGATGGYGEEVKSRGISYVVFDSNQVKNIDNINPSNDPDIRYQLKDMTLKNDTAKYTPERLENILSRYGSKSSPNYSQAYVAHMSPDEFLSLTTTNLSRIESESRKLNLEDLQNETQEIFLRFDIDDKEVTGHEGRHRMVALRDAGVKSVPVVLWQDGEKGKYNKTFLKSLILTGEEFANNKAPGRIEIKNLVPASRAYEKILTRDFADAKGETAVRFQLRDNKSTKDVEKLQNTVTRLKEQFKLTKGVKLDEKAVRRLARTLLNDYSSTYSKTELEGKLYELYNDIANDSIEFDDMDSITREIARDIIENASVLNDNMHKQYSELRSTLRNSNITIADRYKGDFDAVGGWNEFRKRNIGRIHLTNEGMNIDVLYQELIERYPELFLEDISNPADQLMLIEEVLNGLQAIYENPFNRDINEAVGYLSFEIFDGMTSVPEAKPTFADKKKAEKQKAVESEREKSKTRMEALRGKNADDVAWLKYQNKDKLTEVLNKEKAKRDGAVAKVRKQYKDEAYKTWWKNKLKENDVKSHYQEMIKELRAKKNEQIEQTSSRYKERISNIYEDRKVRDIKKNIGRKVKKLDAMLRKPNQKKHIPKQLDKTIAELLASIDFSTDSQKEKTILKLRDIRAEYEKIAKVSDEDGLAATADPYILEALEELHNKRLVDMSFQELEILKNIIAHFEHLVKTYNKAFMNGKWEDISTKSEKILKELRTDAPKTESAYGVINNFKDMLRWGMVTPQMYFERMGETFYTLWNDLRTSLDKKIVNTRKAQDYMNKLLQNSKDVVKEWTGNKAKTMTFKLESGKTVELTPAQVMSFYLLFKREQARGHILGLGIKAAPIVQKDSKGIKRIKKQFEPTKVTLNDISKILGSMTKEQKRIADGIGVFMNTISKQWVNEATLQNYGYELAKEENYFPIKVDKDFLKSDFDNTNLDPTFTSMGFLKATVKGAGNAIILEDVFDVFTEHADKAATYNAFVGITESTKKIINYKTQDDSIKQAMNKKFGIQAFNYLKKFMVDLQGGLRTDRGMPIINWLIKMNKRSMLGLNLRTVVQQPTSIVRASAMIDIKYLLKGIASKGDMDEMFRYSPIALWKSWGYFNLDTGRTMKDIILDTTPLLDKQYALIQKADDITWTKIWNAVKYEIEDTMPGLKVGSKEFFEAVNERFSNIIDRTQVVDTVLHRSELMRDKDSYVKVITSFMSEPIKQYNIGLAAFEKYENDKTPENRNELIRSMSSLIATTAVVSFTTALYDMAHANDDDDETLLDKWLGDILDNVTGIVPIVKDINSIIQGYSVNRMEYIGITKVWRALNRLYNYLEEIALGKKHKYQFGYILTDFIESISYGAGISVSNVTREIETVMRKYIKIAGKDTITNEIYEYLFKK